MSNFSFSSDIKISTKKLNKDEKILIVDGFKRAYGLGVSENFILIPDFETGLIYQVNLIKNKTKILFRDKDNLKYLNFFQKFKKNKLGKQIVQPHDIIIDENSNIYISQMGPGRGSGEGKVTIFDENFKLKKELGLKMHNNYGLISPVMISKNNDKFYISEYGAHKILRFSEKFEFLDWIGQKSEIDEKIKNNSWDLSKQFINVDLNSPHAIKIGPNNNLYIADTDNHRILRYSNSGQFRGWIGKNQNGEIISEKDYEGFIYVADFFFTTCPSICPIMTDNMVKIQNYVKDKKKVKLLSFSVTPEIDSVPVLKEYSINKGVNDKYWNLLTGDKSKIYSLARKSFLVVKENGKSTSHDMIHTESFVLVDREKRIRGFYDGTDDKDIQTLKKDIDILIEGYN